MPGPTPKRRSERRRRNIVLGETVTSISGEIKVAAPPLPASEYWSPNATMWYESLSRSGQALYYEPSDWALAIFCASLITDYDLSIKPPMGLLSTIMECQKLLLVSEDSRRRSHMELERSKDEALPKEIAAIEEYRKRISSS